MPMVSRTPSRSIRPVTAAMNRSHCRSGSGPASSRNGCRPGRAAGAAPGRAGRSAPSGPRRRSWAGAGTGSRAAGRGRTATTRRSSASSRCSRASRVAAARVDESAQRLDQDGWPRSGRSSATSYSSCGSRNGVNSASAPTGNRIGRRLTLMIPQPSVTTPTPTAGLIMAPGGDRRRNPGPDGRGAGITRRGSGRPAPARPPARPAAP